MSKCKRCDKMHMLRADYCEGCQPYVTIAKLESELKVHLENLNSQDAKIDRLREAAKAVVDMSHERAALPGAFKGEIDALAALLKESGE